MPKLRLPRKIFVIALAASGLAAMLAPASAQVAYAHRSPLDGFLSPYDETYGTSPSYQIFPDARGGEPVVRVVRRCQYPDGWNVTDFGRDVNGIPAGRDHACPDQVGGRVRAGY